MGRVKSFFRIGGYVLVTLLTMATLALGLLIAVNRPSGYWTVHAHRWILAVTIGAIVIFQGFPRIFETFWRIPIGERRRKYEKEVNQILGAGYVRIVEESGLKFTEIGFHAFLVRFGLRRHLERIGMVRLPYRAETSGIKWTKGKGVIGDCWQTGGISVADNSVSLKVCHYEGKVRWNKRPKDERMGLTYDECKRSRTVGTIMAVPIVDKDGQFKGCVSLDAPPNTADKIDTEKIRREMESTANAIWLVGRPIDDL